MVELQALAQTEDEMNLLTLRLENVSERFNKLEAEVSATFYTKHSLTLMDEDR